MNQRNLVCKHLEQPDRQAAPPEQKHSSNQVIEKISPSPIANNNTPGVLSADLHTDLHKRQKLPRRR